MDGNDSPYVFRDEPETASEPDPEGKDVVIIEGQAMAYRSYRRSE